METRKKSTSIKNRSHRSFANLNDPKSFLPLLLPSNDFSPYAQDAYFALLFPANAYEHSQVHDFCYTARADDA